MSGMASKKLGREPIKAVAATASWLSSASFGNVAKTPDTGRIRCAAKVDRLVPGTAVCNCDF
jgi:hypothetical protein